MEKIHVLEIEEHWFLNFVKGCEYVSMGLCAFVGAWGSMASQIIKPLFTQIILCTQSRNNTNFSLLSAVILRPDLQIYT